jgi:hypothetical protein
MTSFTPEPDDLLDDATWRDLLLPSYMDTLASGTTARAGRPRRAM